MRDPKLYAKFNELTRKDAEEVLEKYPIKWKELDARVLDIGCGDGGVTSNILKKCMPTNFMKLVGCDRNERSVKHAQELYGSEKVQFMTLNVGENIPDALKESFDHIFSSYTFNWVKEQEIAFTNVYNLLAEGGNCLLLFLGRCNVFDAYENISRTTKWKNDLRDVHTKFISPYHSSQDPASDIEKIMKGIGFKDINVTATRETHVYEDGIYMFKGLMKSLNPFPSLEDNWEEFISDVVALDPGLGTMKYTLIVVRGSK